MNKKELQQKYLAKYNRAKTKAQKLNFTTSIDSNTEYIELALNPRKVIQAPKGYVLISADYSSQEALIAAVLSEDPIMLAGFKDPSPECPETLSVPTDYNGQFVGDENLGKNPIRDIHTMTASGSFAKHFQGRPEYEWCCIARSVKERGKKIRDWSKTIFYGTLYLQSPVTMSQLHKVTEKEAKGWQDGFYKKYHVFQDWQRKEALLGSVRGWTKDGLGRWRCLYPAPL